VITSALAKIKVAPATWDVRVIAQTAAGDSAEVGSGPTGRSQALDSARRYDQARAEVNPILASVVWSCWLKTA
jgi:capsid protein